MSSITISQVTAVSLKNNQYRSDFPEYYELETLEENGLWHDHQNVFDHVVKVFENLENDLAVLTPVGRVYLEQTIGNHSRENLLKVATLLHDIAKKETLIDENGKANCPGHEHLAAGQVDNFKDRFGLDVQSLAYVKRIVLHHGFISDILTQVIAKPEKEELFWTLFQKTVGDVWYELLLLMNADLRGCDLETTVPDQFHLRKNLLDKWLMTKLVTA